MAILLLSEPAPGDPRDQDAAVVVAAVTALDAASPKDRLAIAAALNANLPGFRLALTELDRAIQTGTRPAYFQSRLPEGVTIIVADAGDQKKSFGFLHDGQGIVLDTLPLTPGFDRFALVTIGFVAISLFVFSLWAAISLTRPLTNFANVVEGFGLDSVPAQLPEAGPEEVRKATRAFNRMQRRIAEMAAQRTRMLAAVSHDLRTPITRMRLRAEYLETGDTKAKLVRDLDQMEAMVCGCLTYLRGGAQQEMVVLDLASLLQPVVDQFTDLGSIVRYNERSHISVRGNPDDLDRAFSNLLDNAVKYAENPEIELFERDGDAVVEVSDRGPGIPSDQREAMLEPFERGCADTTAHAEEGFGLGLAIARAIVEAHGGRLVLDERVGGGLIARVSLPKIDIETR
ncbi:ATP-binding protein [Methylosinus sp. H3A]|uniref:ATP-binding protein n=1 Tax=Methylosinus sp. H3A TaxID=2785786 RepID=UPI001FEED130|nr:ATP-binding protein [Methylosinus sp. H3A]